MKRLKTFGKYILCIALFYIFSQIMIFIGLNTTYHNIHLKGEMPQGVSVRIAQTTSVNGEVKGNVTKDISSKYVKFNFYTENDTYMGSYYITPTELENNNFEFYFKMNFVETYSVELTDEEPEPINFENFSLEKYKSHIIFAALLGLIIL